MIYIYIYAQVCTSGWTSASDSSPIFRTETLSWWVGFGVNDLVLNRWSVRVWSGRLFLEGGLRWRGVGWLAIHDVDVSENRGTPKSSILIRFSIINHPFWGTPILGNTHMFIIQGILPPPFSQLNIFKSTACPWCQAKRHRKEEEEFVESLRQAKVFFGVAFVGVCLLLYAFVGCRYWAFGMYTLHETNSKTWQKRLKMDGCKMIVSFWGPAYFQVQTVSFREGKSLEILR